MPSGTPFLDKILVGGWLRGGMYLFAGPPGSGKTTLANEQCFSAAKRGENCLYVTMLAETHSRLMLHLRSLTFYQHDLVGTRIEYLSGASVLKTVGPKGLVNLLGRTIREKDVKVLVIDGFNVISEQVESRNELRELLQALSVKTSLVGCTSFLLTTETNKGTDVEHAMADGIITLSAELIGLKATRGLEVIKFRGSNNIPGKHTFVINQDGVSIFPRWESVYRTSSERVADPARRSRFGIAGLDAMCMGGLITFSSTLVLGSPGSGKTLIGMSFLREGARLGEKGLYFGFAESGQQLRVKTRNVGIPLDDALERGLIQLEVRAPVETLPDAMVQELMNLLDKHGFQRVFIDGLEPFAKEAIDPERTTRFVSALMNAMRDHGATVLVTQQTNQLFGPELHAPIQGVEAICDNMLFLRFFEQRGRLRRLISVLKMRDSDNDPFLRELLITDKGVEVGGTFIETDAIITGQTRSLERTEAPAALAKKVRRTATKVAKVAKAARTAKLPKVKRPGPPMDGRGRKR